MTSDGRLGPHTESRLRRGFSWHKIERYPLVVAAGRSPYNPDQSLTMAKLMHQRLETMSMGIFIPIIVKHAATFDTRGELNALKEIQAGHYVIITAWWHLPRARLIAWQVFPRGTKVSGVADWSDKPTARQLFLEIPKYVHTMLPAAWRVSARRHFEKYFGRSSW